MNAQLQFFFLMLSRLVNRQQKANIEYLQTENKILLEQLGGNPKGVYRPNIKILERGVLVSVNLPCMRPFASAFVQCRALHLVLGRLSSHQIARVRNK